ncbi:MAG: cation diffusion facilitator family transporter [Pseudomonadota bacterium]
MAHDASLAGQPGALDTQTASTITKRVARLSVATAVVLIGLKLWAWLASGSVAMLSSLADSSLDGAASLFTLLAVGYAAMPPDEEHRFGHGKAEAMAAMVQAMLVGISATLVAVEAIDRLTDPKPIAESALALVVMGVSIVLTLALIWAQSRAIAQTGSVATKGDRAHYASDLAANMAVIIGISLAAFSGVAWADPLVGLLVAAWLGWSAFEVARGGWDQLLDSELDDASRTRITELALSAGGILEIHALRTRASGPTIHIQFHAELPPHLTLVEAHKAMVAAEKAILSEFPAADVLIHPDPRGRAEPHGHESIALDEAS